MSFLKKLKEKVTSPKATVTLKLNKNSYVLGEKLEGTLTITAEEEIDATEIRAELRCTERKKTRRLETETRTLPDGRQETRQVWRDHIEETAIYSEDPQASGPTHLSAGYRSDFAFSTNIPPGGRTSYASMDASIKWNIKGVIAVKGRPDITSPVTEIQVVEAPEVVMMPCEYCGTLMPETTLTCPNCGAKRKA